VTAPDPGRVLVRALVAWGWGHLLVGQIGLGRALLVVEIVALLFVAWLTIGLADSSLYLVPFVAGTAFIVAWAGQAVHAYGAARGAQQATASAPMRSPAAAIGLLSLPLLVWGTGFWLIAAHHATPAGVLDRFVTAWAAGRLTESEWPEDILREADRAAAALGTDDDRFRDLRVRVTEDDGERATAVAEAIHFERQPTRFLWVFPGTELVPVADDRVLTLELEARPVELPGGGAIGAVRWELVRADP
jgi:hypothetical protein